MAREMQHQATLLLGRLGLDKPHVGPGGRFTDGLGVSGIILLSLDVWLHVGQRHQALTADDHVALRVDAVDLKYRLCDIETDCCDRLDDWLLRIVGALTAPTSMALMCRWRSRPQKQT